MVKAACVRFGVRMGLVAAVALLTATAAFAQSAGSSDKDYQIKLDRPEKVGQKFQISAAGTEKTTMTVGGNVVNQKSDDLAFDLAGVREILEVNKDGRTTKVSFTVEKCTKGQGDAKTSVIDKGTVVTVKYVSGEKTFEPADPAVTLSDDAKRILKSAVSVKKEDEPSDDKAFGTDARKKVGDTWPANAEVIQKELSKEFPDVKKENISGQVKLAGVSKVNGVDCLDLQVTVKIKDCRPPVPEMTTVVKADMEMLLTGSLPQDLETPMLKSKEAMTFSAALKVAAAEGAEAVSEIKTERNLVTTETPIKK